MMYEANYQIEELSAEDENIISNSYEKREG